MEFHRIGIVGGGFMGRSLAHKVASSGIDVKVLEVSQERVDQSKKELTANLDAELAKWGITASEKKATLSRITYTTEPQGMAGCEMVIEVVPEILATKQEVLSKLHAVLPAEVVFVTSTSTLSVSEIGAGSGRPDRVVGMHFMHPVTMSRIVEIVRGSATSNPTFQHAVELAKTLDKTVIEVFESPGYVVTRAMLPMVNEAIHLVMEGVASAEDVDLALKLAYEFKVGPLEYVDRIGLDTVLRWMEHLFREFGELKYRPCALLRKMVRAGYLGRKVGRGFFHWQGNERVREAAAKEIGR